MHTTVTVIDTSSLGDRSYLVDDGHVAAVIDPQRDIDRVLELAEARGVRITHVLETHIHNDYVTGGLELTAVTDAQYVVAAADRVHYDRHAVADGDVVRVGTFDLTVLHTPGHTHHHVSYVLRDENGRATGVFTGGSMLHGTTGRTDLIGVEHTTDLTHAQFHSVRRLATELPDDVNVYPTHGFGSFCSASPASGDSSTIGDQRANNPALTQDEQHYVDDLIAGLGAYPAYYAHMGVINSSGPPPVDLSMPTRVDADEVRRRIDDGEWVVDLRSRTAFAAGHLAGSLGFELSDNFVTYLGWLYVWGVPLTLIGDAEKQILDARRELTRIGVDRITGAAVGFIDQLRTDTALGEYRVADFHEVAAALDAGPTVLLDVRQTPEYQKAHIPSAIHIPLHELVDRINEVPDGEVWVHCGSGYRASIAASIIDRADRRVILVDAPFADAITLGLAA